MEFMIPGTRLDVTETKPLAPQAIKGTVRPSSPHRTVKSSGTTCISWFTRSTLPPASFTQIMWGQSFARRPTVSTLISIPQRPGMLYSMIGRRVASAMALKWA